MKNCIYKFMNRDGEVIYIGKAKDLKNRLSNHKHLPEECYEELAYIMYASFDTEYEMDFAELYYIDKIFPKYNTINKDNGITFTIQELEVKKFKFYEIKEKTKIVANRVLKEYIGKEFEVLILNMSISQLIKNIELIKEQRETEETIFLQSTLRNFIKKLNKENPLIQFKSISFPYDGKPIKHFYKKGNYLNVNLKFKGVYENKDVIRIKKLRLLLK